MRQLIEQFVLYLYQQGWELVEQTRVQPHNPIIISITKGFHPRDQITITITRIKFGRTWANGKTKINLNDHVTIIDEALYSNRKINYIQAIKLIWQPFIVEIFRAKAIIINNRILSRWY